MAVRCNFSQDYIHDIRATYTKDFVSKDVTKRQIAVATYLIDKLALRAGNEKVTSNWSLWLVLLRVFLLIFALIPKCSRIIIYLFIICLV